MGLGTVGLPAATYLQRAGCHVIGYDISPKAVENAQRHIEATTKIQSIPSDTEVFVVCVTTSLSPDEKPDLSSVYDACREAASFTPALISVESTIPVGTCRDIHETILNGRINLAHFPHRYWPEDSERHGVSQLRVLGAVDKNSMIEARKFYRKVNIPWYAVDPVEIAEMTKVVENAYRYVQIAFAEELRTICARNNLNFNALRNSTNTKWNVDIPEAREGIGGTCLPKDIRYLIDTARNGGHEPDLLTAALQADASYRKHLAEAFVYA
jgi:UDP-N-acetyl-D-mannosaminuronic acid dehydrogenase